MSPTDFPRGANDVLIIGTGSLCASGDSPSASHETAKQWKTGLRALTPGDIPNFDLLARAKGLEAPIDPLSVDLFAGADTVLIERQQRITEAAKAAFFAHAWGNRCGVGGVIPQEYFPDPKTTPYPKGFFKAGEQLVGVSILQAYIALEQIRRQLKELFPGDERKIRDDLAGRTMIDVANGAGSSVEKMERALIEFLLANNDGALGETFGESGWLLGMLGNMNAGHLASAAGIRGLQKSSNAACDSSGVAMQEAFDAIVAGSTDVAIVGGSENPVGPVNSTLPFDCMMGRKGGALSHKWREGRGAEHALTAYSADRDGFVPGNGAGLIVMVRRSIVDLLKVKPIARVLGIRSNTCQSRDFGKSLADGTITGQAALLEELFSSVGVQVAETRRQLVHYLHGTGTVAGAINELYAAAKVLGPIAMREQYVGTGTKEGIGHTLGAAFIMNVIASLEAMQDEIAGLPSTLVVDPAFQEADPSILRKEKVAVDTPPLRAIANGILCHRNVKAASDALWLSTANGFGGSNSAMVMVREK